LRRALLILLVMAGALATQPASAAHAQDTGVNQNPDCQRLWMELAGPVVQRMMYYVQAADQYPMMPNGRPVVSGPPVGYPWSPQMYAPGGPGYNFVGNYGAFGARGLALTGVPGYPFNTVNPLPGGTPLSLPFVANQVVNTAGGLANVAPGDLIGLADSRLGLAGNVIGAVDVRNNIVGTRLGMAQFNMDYSAYPMTMAVNYREVLEGLDFHVRNACPRAPAEDSRNGSNRS
jgi:hypothetical protein